MTICVKIATWHIDNSVESLLIPDSYWSNVSGTFSDQNEVDTWHLVAIQLIVHYILPVCYDSTNDLTFWCRCHGYSSSLPSSLLSFVFVVVEWSHEYDDAWQTWCSHCYLRYWASEDDEMVGLVSFWWLIYVTTMKETRNSKYME